MTLNEFFTHYWGIAHYDPTYRIGQHFINKFCKNEDDVRLTGLWEMGYDEAVVKIYEIIEMYQWDVNNLVEV